MLLLSAAMLGCERQADEADSQGTRSSIRIVAVTHGQSADPFWSVVSNGINDAAKDLGVRVEYQAPTTFDMVRMSQLIDAAVASRPAALLVSVPDADALGGSIRKAIAAGIPVVSINSGADAWQQLGVLGHVGQTEYEAGFAGGEKLAAAGARRVLCVNHEVGNLALDERCRGLSEALRASGGTVSVLGVNLADPTDAQQRIANALRDEVARGASKPGESMYEGQQFIDGVLTLGPGGATPALAAVREIRRGIAAETMPPRTQLHGIRRIRLGTFDLTADVLEALQKKEMLFAIDQQPYLQGYLGVTLLVKYLETGAMAGGQQVIRTGPGFVTPDNAQQVAQMIERGVR
jgi:simple sugar transport system substrate-binding protein